MKSIEVGCAIIIKKDEILISQRNHSDFLGGYWEFPGGKREPEESFEECVVREVLEELGVHIRPKRFLVKTEHTYPEKKVALHFYLCDWLSGDPQKLDCLDFMWLKPNELRKYQFPLGDEEIISDLIDKQKEYFGS